MACSMSPTGQVKAGQVKDAQCSSECSTADTLSPCEEEWESPSEDLDTSAPATAPACPRPQPPVLAELVDVRRWEPGRFRAERTLQEAPRNHGRVLEVLDVLRGGRFAVKEMPRRWACASHAHFARQRPRETEQPWVDIGCLAFLSAAAYPYACALEGVYRDEDSLRVVMELASEGDIFVWASACGEEPGPGREELCRPVARQILDAVRWLHDLSIVHRDISAENILLTRGAHHGPLQVRLIDFGMSTGHRYSKGSDRGKPSYQAPELHSGDMFDGFLADAFGVGVVLYIALLREYPWLSTAPGACKSFGFCRTRGLRVLMERRSLAKRRANPEAAAAAPVSEPLLRLLEGLMAVNPAKRLTLGECAWFEVGGNRSVWEEPWVQGVSHLA